MQKYPQLGGFESKKILNGHFWEYWKIKLGPFLAEKSKKNPQNHFPSIFGHKKNFIQLLAKKIPNVLNQLLLDFYTSWQKLWFIGHE